MIKLLFFLAICVSVSLDTFATTHKDLDFYKIKNDPIFKLSAVSLKNGSIIQEEQILDLDDESGEILTINGNTVPFSEVHGYSFDLPDGDKEYLQVASGNDSGGG